MSTILTKTSDTNPGSDSVLYAVDDPGGTPADTKVTAGDLITKAHGLSNGILKIAAGVMALAVQGIDYYAPGGTDVAVADGGTGASNASGARTNLGLGTVATLDQDTDGTLAGNSDSYVATQKAVKTYVDTTVTGLLKFKGSTDASANPNYPVAKKGDAYIVSVAGKVGGASGKSVDVGDVYLATADNAGGAEGAVGTSWSVLEHNLVGALLSSNNLSDLASASTARTNLGLGTVATLASDTDGTLASNSDSKVATQKATKTYVDTRISNVLPSDHGLSAWAYDPVAATNSSQLVNGSVYLVAVYLRQTTTITNAWFNVGSVAVTPTANQNFIGLYNSSGSLLGSVDIGTATTSLGPQSAALTPASAGSLTNLAAGLYWVAIMVNAATPPFLSRGTANGNTLFFNANLSASTFRFAVNGTGLTALPSPITPGSNSRTGAISFWAAVN